MTTGTELKTKLQNGEPVFGTMLFLARNPRWARVFGGLDLDYVIVDTEHAAYGRGEVADMVAAISGAGLTPIVRVPFPDAREVRRVLDGGAHGVLVPYCETVDEVRAVASAARWRPLKGALLERVQATGELPNEVTRDQLQQSNRNVVLLIGIESTPAVENLDAILQVEGIDVIFIGPLDMTVSMGIPGEIENPAYEAVVQDVIDRSTARGVAVAIHVHSVDHAVKWVEAGARFIIFRSDTRALTQIFKDDLAVIAERLQSK